MRRFLLGACVLAAACGGSSKTPSAPTPTPQSITVTSSSDQLFIGASETFAATVTMSDGTTRAISGGTWISENPNFASVDGTGRVTGVGSGPVNIYVDYEGRRGGRLIRVLPNFQGTWSGSYVSRSCSQTGQMAGAKLCDTFAPNRVLPTNFVLTQDHDRVDGRFYLGTLAGDGSGPVQSDGRLAFVGSIREGSSSIDTMWALDSASAGRATGSFSFIWRFVGLSGEVRVSADIRDLNRTSTLIAPQATGPRPTDRSLQGTLRALAAHR